MRDTALEVARSPLYSDPCRQAAREVCGTVEVAFVIARGLTSSLHRRFLALSMPVLLCRTYCSWRRG